MKQIVGAVHEQLRSFFELLAKRGMRSGRTVADGDDMARTEEDGGLAIFHVLAFKAGRSRHHEQMVAIDFDLGKLVAPQGVLDGQRMKIVARGQRVQFRLGRIGDSDPDELRLLRG